MSPQNKPIVILGTGRSGTSAIAGILHYLGVNMGDVFVAADKTNPYGHFEDVDFVSTHRAIATSHTPPEKAVQILKDVWIKKQSHADSHHTRWGFKDPLTTNLVDFYLRMGFEMEIIWAYRDFAKVEQSSLKAYNWTPKVTRDNLHGRLEIMEKLTRQNKVAVKIDFDDLLQNPADVIARIIDTFKLKPTPEQVKNALQHIRTKEF